MGYAQDNGLMQPGGGAGGGSSMPPVESQGGNNNGMIYSGNTGRRQVKSIPRVGSSQQQRNNQ